MKHLPIIAFILLIMGCQQRSSFIYPVTAKVDSVDVYHGTRVPDPFRWLEDDMSEETAAWVRAQNEVTFDYLEKIPFRKALKDRMTQVWNYPRMGTPEKEGDLYFYSYNSGLQNQAIIYITEDLESEGEIFLDPNSFSKDGTAALSSFSVSKDSRYAAYGISKSGSDWVEFYVRDVKTGKDLDDHIQWVKFSGIAWYRDGFFYSRYDEPREGDELKGENKNSQVFYHRIGTLQSKDMLIYKNDDEPDWGFNVEVTEDEKYMVLSVAESTSGNALAFRKAGIDSQPFTWLDKDFDNDYTVVGNDGDMLFLLTNLGAPLYRLIRIDLNDPAPENWEDIIPEHERNVLESATLAGGRIVATFLQDACNTASVYEMNGTFLHELSLPGIGSLENIEGKRKEQVLFYSFSSFTYPSTIFKYNIDENLSEVFYAPEIDFNIPEYETRQVFYSSKDGTRVPMFIVHKKGLELNGGYPTLLYGYGGFNITKVPTFDIRRVIWLEQGGVFALANIRGGGTYGEAWHKAGTVLQKQNVFDDFIAAAEYLIEKEYTSPGRLAIYGGSNGGLLIGAVVNQRPDLFAAAVPMVGVMDMLRFHKFTIGRYWTVDYGSSDDPEQFKYLIGYSPLHNISSDKAYPAVLVTTGDHDDRVVPAHSFKYIATLQEKYRGNNPVMIRISTDAGHGAGKPTAKLIDEYSDIWSFIFTNLDFTPVFE